MVGRLALAVVALWAITGFVSQPARAAAPVSVAMHQYRYHPDHLDLEVGQPVTWTNEDSAHHDVSTVSGPEQFASTLLATGESFTWVPSVAGEFTYVCTIHDDMTGTISVTAVSVPTTTTTTAAPLLPPSAATQSTTTTQPAVVMTPPSPPVVVSSRVVSTQPSLRGVAWPIAAAVVAVTFTVALMKFDRRRSV